MRLRRLLLILALVALTGAGVYEVWRRLPHALVDEAMTPRERQIELGMVVTRVRALNRLETASMRVIHTGTITQSYALVPNTLGGDSLTLQSTGDVIAGVDLAQLRPGDVWRQSDGTVMMRLPPPQILVTRIDNEHTRVLTRKTGLFRRGDDGLEGRARQFAEASVRTESIRQGILNLAAKNAENRIAELLHATGVERIEFVENVGNGETR
jgi:hypothetical protein